MTTTDTNRRAGLSAEEAAAPVVVVSGDTHITPRVREDLRSYCPASYLEAYDEFLAVKEAQPAFDLKDMDGVFTQKGVMDDGGMAKFARYMIRARKTEGHWDVHQRLRDMDRDGVAAEVIFAGSMLPEPMPFAMNPFDLDLTPEKLELFAVGIHMYNQWLADQCSVEPERHAGLVHLPMWDIDACVAEVQWAREAGLKGVNFPQQRDGVVDYDDPAWEPFWSACEDTEMHLTTHAGAGDPLSALGKPHALLVFTYEIGGWLARRAMPRLIFSGVFERHPKLFMAITEAMPGWWDYTMAELDSVYTSVRWSIENILPRKPSEYAATNLFMGISGMAPFEAKGAIARGYAKNVMWGSDYPHVEGTWQYQENPNDYPTTKSQLRYCFGSVEPEYARMMAGENASRLYGFDMQELGGVAERIGALTAGELATPLEELPDPELRGFHCWRTEGGYH